VVGAVLTDDWLLVARLGAGGVGNRGFLVSPSDLDGGFQISPDLAAEKRLRGNDPRRNKYAIRLLYYVCMHCTKSMALVKSNEDNSKTT